MKINFLTGVIGAALILSPLGWAQRQSDGQGQTQGQSQRGRDSDGVRQAIAFQRAKDLADERQARQEARHPSVNYSNADRRADDSDNTGHVSDPGESQAKKHKN